MRVSTLLNDHVGSGGDNGDGESGVSDALGALDSSPQIQLEAIANAKQFEAETRSVNSQVRAQLTLNALNQLGRYLANIPGRKNVIWFSGSFPVSILPDADVDNGFAALASANIQFRETMRLLAKSQVALYPVDARGLTTTGTYSAANPNQKYAQNPQAIGKDVAKYNVQHEREDETMLQAARDTGGRAFINTNGLSDAVAKAIDDGANYYTLSYAPLNKALDGRYRRVKIATRQAGLTLAYRQGYFADDALHPADTTAVASHTEAETSLITRSMVRGAPPATQIQFTLRVRPVDGQLEATLAPGNELSAENVAAKPPYRRFAVDFAVETRDFFFVKIADKYEDAVQFVAFVYDADGALVLRTGSTLRMDFDPATHAEFLRRPLSYNQDVSVPARGSYFLRVAVQDLNSQQIGSFEIPLDAVRGLPPLSAPASAPK